MCRKMCENFKRTLSGQFNNFPCSFELFGSFVSFDPEERCNM